MEYIFFKPIKKKVAPCAPSWYVPPLDINGWWCIFFPPCTTIESFQACPQRNLCRQPKEWDWLNVQIYWSQFWFVPLENPRYQPARETPFTRGNGKFLWAMLFLRVCELFDNDDEKWQTLAKLLLVLQALLNLTVVPHQSERLLHHHVEKHGPDTERVNETVLFHTRVASHTE